MTCEHGPKKGECRIGRHRLVTKGSRISDWKTRLGDHGGRIGSSVARIGDQRGLAKERKTNKPTKRIGRQDAHCDCIATQSYNP